MTRYLSGIILLAVLFVFVGSTVFSAGDLDKILDSHDPLTDNGVELSTAVKAAVASATAPAAGGAVSSATAQLDAKLTDTITKIMDVMTKILQILSVTDFAKKDPGDAAKAGSYTVVPGDSLWAIAEKFLGDGSRYWELVEANKDKYPSILKNPNLIYPGWELSIPGGGGQTSPGGSTATPAPGSSTPSTPVPTGPAPAPGAKGGAALLGWLQQAGLSGENLKTAWAVGMAESGGNPRAFNGNSNTGDKSYGLYQINMIGSLGPARLKQYGLKSNEDLFDPATNVRVMIKMSGNCSNWSPWSAYKNGAYKKFLSQYPPK